jgi:arylsulfatase A-like enzyme
MSSIGKRAVVTCALGAALLAGPDVQVTHGQTTKPNIVMVMIDDFDLTSLWTLVATGKMPNLTKYFVQGGAIFSEAFSVNGLGGPARATTLTGQYAHNHGVTWGFAPRDLTVLNESSTVATWLKTAGYRTGHIGRYLTGYGWWVDPRIPPGWDDWKTLLDPSSNNTEQYSMTLNGQLVNFGQLSTALGVQLHQVDILSVLATDFIRREAASASPFFLMLTPGVFNLAVEPTYNVCPGPGAPHYEPFFDGSIYGAAQVPATRHMGTIFGDTTKYPLPRPPSFNETEIWDKPVWIRFPEEFSAPVIDCLQKRYWRKLEGMLAIDDMIGSVFGELERTGELANTVAIFTGDNGWLDGQHRFSGKGAPYEEAIRIPLIIRPRGAAGQTQLITKMALNSDLAPTIANFAEATATHVVDGRSLVPLLVNPNPATWRKIALLEYEGDRDPIANMPLPPTYNAVRTDRSRPTVYVKYPNVLGGFEAEYYDLAVDPFQLNNQFYEASRQAERARLELFLAALKSCKGVSCQILENYFSF